MELPTFSQLYMHEKSPEDIFQRFIADLFGNTSSCLLLFPTEGKDGCIDIFGQIDSMWTVWECKYSKHENFATASERWKEVENKLDEYLTDSGPGNQRQYLPWYDTTKPIKRYNFCFSGTCHNAKNWSALEETITNAFKRWADRSPLLDHLRNIEVNFYPWDRLRGMVLKHQQVLFKYFLKNQVDYGIVEFQAWMSNQKGFKRYLDSSHLNYFPITGLEPDFVIDELRNTKQPGILIYGKGGVGKSRLLVEIGKSAMIMQWSVFVVDVKKFNKQSLQWLIGYLNEKTALLIVDYIEAWEYKDDIMDELDIHDIDYIKILGSCRTIQKEFANIDERLLPLQIPPNSESIISFKILETIPTQESLVDFCRNIPAFAAFCKYMYDNGKLDDFFQSKENNDFSKWLANRIPHSPASTGTSPIAKLVATYPCTDEQLDIWQDRDPSVYAVHSFLHKDGWVLGGNGEPYSIVHDIIADHILLAQFRSSDKWRTLREFLKDSSALKSTSQLLVTLQRIKDCIEDIDWIKLSNSFNDIDIQSDLLSNGILNRGLINLIGSVDFIVNVDNNKIDELALVPSIRKSITRLSRIYSERRDAHSEQRRQSLSKWMISIYSASPDDNEALGVGLLLGIEGFSDIATKRFNDLGNSPEASFILVGLIKLDTHDKKIRDVALSWLQLNIVLFESVYVIIAWVNKYKETVPVTNLIIKWLDSNKNIKSRQSGYLFDAWIKNYGDSNIIIAFIIEWITLNNHGDTSLAAIVLDSLLRVSPSEDVIHVTKKWLEFKSNNQAFPTRYLLCTMLRKVGSPNSIIKYINEWLKVYENVTYIYTQKLFVDWLDCGGDWETIKPYFELWVKIESNRLHIESSNYISTLLKMNIRKEQTITEGLAWLSIENNCLNVKAQYVMSALIESECHSSLIEPFLGKWLNISSNIISKEAFGVYASWLKRQYSINYIMPYIENWFIPLENATYIRASYIFKPFFNYKHCRDKLKFQLKAWLEEPSNRTDIDTENVFESWLRNGGEYSWIQTEINDWLNHSNNRLSPQARFVFTSCLDAGVNPKELLNFILEWLSIPTNITDPQTQHLFRSWIDATKSIDSIKKEIITWLKVPSNRISDGASFVYPRLLKMGKCDFEIFDYIEEWMAIRDNFASRSSQYILIRWIESGLYFDKIEQLTIKWLSNEKHLFGDQSSYIFQHWTSKNYPISKIENKLILWINSVSRDQLLNTSMVLGSVLAYENELSQEMVHAVERFVKSNNTETEISFVLRQTSKSTLYSSQFVDLTIEWCINHPGTPRTVKILDNIRKQRFDSKGNLFLKAIFAYLNTINPNRTIDPSDRIQIFNLICQSLLLSKGNNDNPSIQNASRLAKVLIPLIEKSGPIISTALPWQKRAVAFIK